MLPGRRGGEQGAKETPSEAPLEASARGKFLVAEKMRKAEPRADCALFSVSHASGVAGALLRGSFSTALQPPESTCRAPSPSLGGGHSPDWEMPARPHPAQGSAWALQWWQCPRQAAGVLFGLAPNRQEESALPRSPRPPRAGAAPMEAHRGARAAPLDPASRQLRARGARKSLLCHVAGRK